MIRFLKMLSFFCACLIITSLVVSGNIQAQGATRAGLVVQFSDGQIETRCVEMSTGSLTGIAFLEASGLKFETANLAQGIAVCKINATGCLKENCFCGSPPNYWSYWHLQNDVWVYSPTGAESYFVQPGEVEGWSWSDGKPPQVISFEEICGNQQETSITPTSFRLTDQQDHGKAWQSQDWINILVFSILVAGLLLVIFKIKRRK